MRLLSATIFLTLFAMTFSAGAASVSAAPLPAAHQVDIPLGNGVLHAQLYKPDGDGPFPTVIALHGCGGLGGHSEPVLPRYRDWAEQLLKEGNAVLLPDSYGSRELGPQCRVKERPVLARRERVADIMASRQWLVQQPWAAHDRISLLGWANGASALLWAVRPQLSSRNRRAGFPLGDRVLSGLPRLLRPWLERARSDAAADRRQGRRQFAARLPPDDRRRARPQRAGADRGLSRRLSRFRPRQFAAACDRRNGGCRRAGARPSRHRHRSARRFAKARRRMAGAVTSRFETREDALLTTRV